MIEVKYKVIMRRASVTTRSYARRRRSEATIFDNLNFIYNNNDSNTVRESEKLSQFLKQYTHIYIHS